MVDAAPILRMVNLTKQFGRLVAVNDVSLDIQEGEFFTIVGPSGSGKTTLLRMLGGLEKPTAGDIYLARRAGQPGARQPAADLHGLPVARALQSQDGRPEHRVLAEDAGARAGVRAASAASRS